MITRITKANADKYRALFAEAVEALSTHDSNGKKPGQEGFDEVVISIQESFEPVSLNEDTFIGGVHYIEIGEGQWQLTSEEDVFNPEAKYAVRIEASEKITTLEEYFCYIADLRAIDKKFTILPLEDEENFFAIDANSRKIEVPKSFKDNGVAVQGDEIAEILYFKIDRYFDMDDLGEKQVYIQWLAPADEKGNRKKGVSAPWVVNTNICPGYVIIGWPLASELTQNAGKIDFSVRFFTIPEEGELTGRLLYSLSTLPATVEVKAGLNYDLENISLEDIIDSEFLINNRLVNSDITDANTPDPILPVFLSEDEVIETIGDEHTVVSEDEAKYKTYKVYMTNKETGEEQDGTFTVQAYITDTGSMGYGWVKRDEEGDVVQDVNMLTVFEPVDDEERNISKVYYTKEGEDTYAPFSFTDEINDLVTAAEAGIQLYERKSRVVMNVSGENVLGSYQVRVTNRRGRKTTRAFGNIALVEGPEAPVISEDIGEIGVFENNSINLTIEVESDEHAYTTYQLQRGESADGDFEFIGSASTRNEFVVKGDDYDAEDDGDGFYRVAVVSKLNSVLKSVTGQPMRITHAAMPVSITTNEPTYVAGGSSYYDVNKPLEVMAVANEFEKRIDGVDTITYQWYRYNGSDEEFLTDLESASVGTYVVKKDSDILLEGATGAVLNIQNTKENEAGHYFCEVTNTYNGSKAVKCSKFFDVVDTKVNA